jgi:hypothetical protein
LDGGKCFEWQSTISGNIVVFYFVYFFNFLCWWMGFLIFYWYYRSREVRELLAEIDKILGNYSWIFSWPHIYIDVNKNKFVWDKYN